MNNLSKIIKDRVITGFLFVVPLAIIIVLLIGQVKQLMLFIKPLAENIPIGGPLFKSMLTYFFLLVVLIAILLIAGILINTYVGSHIKNWAEEKLLKHLPFFKTLSLASKQITGASDKYYKVVEMRINGSDNKVLGVLTEKLRDGRNLVYVPFSPLVNIGQLYICEKKDMEDTDMKIKEFIDITSQIGLEATDTYEKK